MFATKLKLAVAAVLATCALGFGTLSASGNGSGEGDGTQPGAKGTGGAPTKPLAPPAPKEKTPADLLQGSWRVTAITEGGKTAPTRANEPWVIEIRSATLTMPFQEAGKWKTREYTFKAGTEGIVGTLDLIAGNKPMGRGIYEFTLPQQACAKCHSGTVTVPAGALAEVCTPARAALTPKSEYGVRLALPINGKRPATFSDKGGVVFDMVRAAIDPDKAARLEDLLRERELRARIEAQRDRVASDAREREKLRMLAEQLDWLAQQQATAAEAKLLRAKLEQAMVLAERAAQQVEVARQQAAMAQDVARAAEAQLAQAKAQQAELMAALEVLRKKAEAAQPVPKELVAATFTVHVRTLTAAEKVHKVKHTNQTILEAIVYAADDVPVKSDAVSVWIVRGKEVLTVDLPAILKNGETKTNYVVKPGDQVFVQAKPAK